MTARQTAKVRQSYRWVLLIAGLLPMVASLPVVLTPGQAPADFHTGPRPTWSQPVSASSQAGQVAYTLALVTNTLIPGNFLPANGFDPVAVAADSRNGYLYVANSGSSNVAVIDGATNKVVAWIPVGTGPRGVAFDSSNGDLYVTNLYSNNVVMIDGATNKVIGSIPVGSGPWGVAFDSSNGYLYVADYFSDVLMGGRYFSNVTIIDGATNKVLGSVLVGERPYGVAFDSSNGDVYATNSGSDNVAVIDGATYRVIGSIPVGLAPEGVTFDSASGDVYVTNTGSNNVTVIDGASNRVIGSIPVGLAPEGVALDGSNGYAYVTNFHSGSVSLISSQIISLKVSAGASRARADVGQPVLFTCAPTGGAPPYSFSWVFGDGISGSGQTVSHVYATPYLRPAKAFAEGLRTATCTVTDSAGSLGGGSTTVVLSSDPTVTLVATPSSFLVGQRVAFSAVAQGGGGGYSYNWSGLPPGCGGATNSPNYSCTPSSAGSYNVTVTVTDGNGMSARSVVGIIAKPSLLGMPAAVGYGILATSVAVPAIAATIAAVWSRRRRKAPPPAGDEAQPPG